MPADDSFPLDSDLYAMTDDGGPLDPYPGRHEAARPVLDRPDGETAVDGDRWQDRYDLTGGETNDEPPPDLRQVQNVHPPAAGMGGADDRDEVAITTESDNAGENGSG